MLLLRSARDWVIYKEKRCNWPTVPQEQEAWCWHGRSFWGGLRKLTVMSEGERKAGMSHGQNRRKREKGEVIYTFKQSDLMRTHSLSWELTHYHENSTRRMVQNHSWETTPMIQSPPNRPHLGGPSIWHEIWAATQTQTISGLYS